MSEIKVRSICVDTLTGIQQEMYMSASKKPGHDQWADIGKDIWVFMTELQNRGFETILILGEPGTGKSTGMRTLKPNTNIWFNADNKNPVWIGGTAEYGKKNAPRLPYHLIPKSYQDILDHIDLGLSKGMFEDDRYAILTGHVETFKSGNDTLQRLKVLGKLATKMQLEGKLETVMYSTVVKEGSELKYLLETQNNSFNTARSPQGLFEPKIDNDYQFIIDKLVAGY